MTNVPVPDGFGATHIFVLEGRLPDSFSRNSNPTVDFIDDYEMIVLSVEVVLSREEIILSNHYMVRNKRLSQVPYFLVLCCLHYKGVVTLVRINWEKLVKESNMKICTCGITPHVTEQV